MRYPAGVLEFTGLRNYSSTTVLALRALEADDVTQWQNPIRQQPQTVHSSDLAPPHSWVRLHSTKLLPPLHQHIYRNITPPTQHNYNLASLSQSPPEHLVQAPIIA